MQVDERDVIDFTDVYDGSTSWGSFSGMDYTDAGTFTGPDTDATLDDDDEIVFMAKDAGQRPPTFSEPSGVVDECSGTSVVTRSIHERPGKTLNRHETAATVAPGASDRRQLTLNSSVRVGNSEEDFMTRRGKRGAT